MQDDVAIATPSGLGNMETKSVIVETGRIRLRPHGYSDFADVAALWADPSVIEHIMPEPLSRSEAWTRLLRYVGHLAMLPYGYWVVEDRTSREFLGEVGFADWKREINPSIEGLPEIGWVIKSPAQRQGLATEAIQAALNWADQNIDAPHTVALISPAHDISMKLARRFGFGEPETGSLRNSSVLILRRALANAT